MLFSKNINVIGGDITGMLLKNKDVIDFNDKQIRLKNSMTYY